MAAAVPALKLASGRQMPAIGFGLWKVNKPTCADTVYNAIKSGYRLFDGAADYGNEKEAGEGVRRAITDGLVKREDLFITSKLWNTFHKREHVHEAVKLQLGLWGIDYFDLFLIHFPISIAYVPPSTRYPPEWYVDGKSKVELQDTPVHETWAAMEEVHSAGQAKNIGVSNFQGSLLLDLWRYAKVKPAALQVEIHPYLPQPGLLKLCRTLGLAVTSYSTFGPSSFVELGADMGAQVLFEHQTITSIAQKHGKTPAQVILRWALSLGCAVIPKSNNQERLEQNLQSAGFELSEAEVKEISAIGEKVRVRFNDPAEIDPRMAIFA